MTPLVVTLTLNPAIDIATSVERVVPVHKLRCGRERRDAGGGGINVARVLHRLDANVLAIYTSGGATGRMLTRLLDAEDIPCRAIPIAGETREDFTVAETATGEHYRFVLPGPVLERAEYDAVLRALRKLDPKPRYVVASGSLPPEAPISFYCEVAKVAHALGAEIVVDASGPALAAALDQELSLIKPSLREFRELTRSPLEDEASQLEAAAALVASRRVGAVALTMGEQGALLVTRDGAWRGYAPEVRTISAVGAGDSFLGALVARRVLGNGYDEALRYAIAAGTASLLSPGTGLSSREGIEAMLPRVRTETISL